MTRHTALDSREDNMIKLVKAASVRRKLRILKEVMRVKQRKKLDVR